MLKSLVRVQPQLPLHILRTVTELQPDAREFLRRRVAGMFPGRRIDGKLIAENIAFGAAVLGAGHVELVDRDGWWFVASEFNWLRGSKAHDKEIELFEAMLPFPSSRPRVTGPRSTSRRLPMPPISESATPSPGCAARPPMETCRTGPSSLLVHPRVGVSATVGATLVVARSTLVVARSTLVVARTTLVVARTTLVVARTTLVVARARPVRLSGHGTGQARPLTAAAGQTLKRKWMTSPS